MYNLTKFNQNIFNNFILDNNVIGFFEKPITLKSGRQSHWYANWRNVSSDVFLTDQLSDFLISFASDLKFSHNGFYGVPEGATKLAIITTFKWAKGQPNYSSGSHRLSMGRGKPKEHGSPADKYFVGEPRGKIIIVEDVTTTGGSLISTIKALKESNIEVVAAVGLTNRMELDDNKKSVADAVLEYKVPYYAMSRATELLPELCRRLNPDIEIINAIKREFEEYGVEGLNF